MSEAFNELAFTWAARSQEGLIAFVDEAIRRRRETRKRRRSTKKEPRVKAEKVVKLRPPKVAKPPKVEAPTGRRRKRRSPPFASIQKHVSRAVAGKADDGAIFQSLGYSAHDLRRHLERQFHAGMTWDNYAGRLPWKSKRKKWHIDHVVPKSKFHQSDAQSAYALTNLRPLWERDNLLKAAKRTHLL